MISWYPFLISDQTSSTLTVTDTASMMVSDKELHFFLMLSMLALFWLINTTGTHAGIYEDSMMVTDAGHGVALIY